MKKFISIIITLSLLLIFCSCGSYVNSYSALGLVKSQTSHSCNTSFLSLNGRLVFKLKCPHKSTDGNIKYSVQVDKGELYLYYDYLGVKEELAHVKAGETVENIGGYVEAGKSVYIIIEATETAKGKVSCELGSYTP